MRDAGRELAAEEGFEGRRAGILIVGPGFSFALLLLAAAFFPFCESLYAGRVEVVSFRFWKERKRKKEDVTERTLQLDLELWYHISKRQQFKGLQHVRRRNGLVLFACCDIMSPVYILYIHDDPMEVKTASRTFPLYNGKHERMQTNTRLGVITNRDN